MTIYNVSATVVELVEATSEAQAIDHLVMRLKRSGFDIYEGSPPDAFESEDA